MITKKDLMLCDKITEENGLILHNENSLGVWKANIKYDGERIAIIKKGENIFLMNRAGREKSFIYPEILEGLNLIKEDFVIDGEVITLDEKFNSLQHRSNLGQAKVEQAKIDYPIKFMAFDILFFDGKDLRQLPLKDRIKVLQDNFKDFNIVEFTDIYSALSLAKSRDLEGIVIKNMLSIYEGKRSKSWLKLKLFKEAELRIISYVKNNAGIRCEDKELNAVQISGRQHDEVMAMIDEKGFCDINIQYLEKTKMDRFRFISYKGLAKNE